MLSCKKFWVLAGLLLVVLAAPARDNVIRMTSLDWPPYTLAPLPGQGASADLARRAFKAMGYELVVEFYPWTRAVKMAKADAHYVGYFPEYHSAEIAKEFIFSDRIGTGPLGFAERVDHPIVWKTLDDLSQYRIGVVQDYVNTEEFDRRVAAQQLHVDVATRDALNLIKLAYGRIDLAVVDRNVFNYLINSAELSHVVGKLQFNEHILEEKGIYMCFRKDPQGALMAKVFNEGLKKVRAKAAEKATAP